MRKLIILAGIVLAWYGAYRAICTIIDGVLP